MNEIYAAYLGALEESRQKRFELSVRFVFLIFQISGGALIVSAFPQSRILTVIALLGASLASMCWWFITRSARENFRMKLLVARKLEVKLSLTPIETEIDILKNYNIQHKYEVVEKWAPISFGFFTLILSMVLLFQWYPFTFPIIK